MSYTQHKSSPLFDNPMRDHACDASEWPFSLSFVIDGPNLVTIGALLDRNAGSDKTSRRAEQVKGSVFYQPPQPPDFEFGLTCDDIKRSHV